MKRMLFFLFNLILILSITVLPVSAAEINQYERDLMDFIKNGFSINGVTEKWYVETKNLNELEDYLLKIDMTEEQGEEIKQKIRDINELCNEKNRSANTVNEKFQLGALSKKEMLKIKGLIDEAAAVIDCTLRVEYSRDLKKVSVFVLDKKGNTIILNEQQIKNNGFNYKSPVFIAIISMAAIAGVFGVTIFWSKKSKQ